MSPTQSERRAATRAALVAAGRELFARDGFEATSLEALVAQAGVTRGALYHHFADKRDLFRAVHEELEEELMAFVAQRLTAAADPLAALIMGTDAFLERCGDPEFARLALEVAPAALGWAEWRAIDLRYGLGVTVALLEAAMDAGDITRQPALPLGHLLIAALAEAGLLMRAGQPRAEAREPLVTLIAGLRA